MRSRSLAAPILVSCLGLAALLPAACSSDESSLDVLLLSVTADAPGDGARIDRLRFIFNAGDAKVPADLGDSGFTTLLGSELDPTVAPVRLEIAFGGASFPDPIVTMQVTAWAKGSGGSPGRLLGVYQGDIDLSQKGLLEIHIGGIDASTCDTDGDGFLNCDMPGCCPGGDSLADCEPNEATANPWATEDPCEPCDDTIDQDCDGQDAPCKDSDFDTVPDCEEEAAGCGVGDGAIYPGAAEKCDDLDNDCNGETDEGFTYFGQEKGESCGLGACDGGLIVCTGDGSGVLCSTAGNASGEECGDAIDNDCDGQTDEQCEVVDVDGDSFSVADGDCNDYDSGVFPGAPEPCCRATLNGDPRATELCEKNCELGFSFCAIEDKDADGFLFPEDCDDNDPLVHPGAPERCGDGKDQDCVGGDIECALVTDGDGDGWSPPADCQDGDSTVNPGAVESCDGRDEDCDGAIDDGNPGGGTECGTDLGVCELGIEVCFNSEGVTGEIRCSEPSGTTELCDGLDNDCDGQTDEGFTWEGLAIGAECDGTGICGAGVVECVKGGDLKLATCSSMPLGSAPEAKEEVCDGLDNDCDGGLNEDLTSLEDSTCLVKGVCALALTAIKAVCNADTTGTWSCDYSGVADWQGGIEVSCDGKDNNCDGAVDESFDVGEGCDGADADSCENGVWRCGATPSERVCDESGSQTAVDICDGKDNDCDGQTDEDYVAELGKACDTEDSDECKNGVVECLPGGAGTGCLSETALNIADICDGLDNDCDGQTDEAYPTLGQPCDGPGGDMCENGVVECKPDGTDVFCGGEPSSEIKEVCDGIDNDCDGQTDEDAVVNGLGQPCDGPADVDLCKEGVWICNPDTKDNQVLKCDEEVAENVEVCDGLDNNCNDITDEGFGLGPLSLGDSCDGDDGDLCATGKLVCNPMDPTADALCDEALGAGLQEQCNNIDDDCDNATDEDIDNVVEAGCLLVGACEGATSSCTAGEWSCHYSDDYQAGDELGRCDDIDNDCDGETDEDFGDDGTVKLTDLNGTEGLVLGDGCGVGRCLNGLVACSVDGQSLVCDSHVLVVQETCNNKDDDCDGTTDDGLADSAAEEHLVAGGCDDESNTGVCGQLTASCVGGVWACNYPGNDTDFEAGEEITCDLLDNDCDGATDEPFGETGSVRYTEPDGVTMLWLGQDCGVGQCDANGKVVCNGKGLGCTTLALGSDEICDQVDNDCDGDTDETFRDGSVVLAGAAYAMDNGKVLDDTCGTGGCGTGQVVCAGPGALSCNSDAFAESADVCNGVDDDCDGETDEDLQAVTDADIVQAACGDKVGKGVCGTLLTASCAAGGTWQCDTPIGFEETEVSCNGVDDDCDGETDEHFKAGGGATFSNPLWAADPAQFLDDTCGTGRCAGGTVVCDGPSALRCESVDTPLDEICNGADDDCDGEDDEIPDAATVAEMLVAGCLAVGACDPETTTSTATCDGSAGWVCQYGPDYKEAEVCDGKDNDCNGGTDEPFKAAGAYVDPYWLGAPPTSLGLACGTGACGGGTVVCHGTDAVTCSSFVARKEQEECNAIDDNCDGGLNEGLTAVDASTAKPNPQCETDGVCGEDGATVSCIANAWGPCVYASADYEPDGEVSCDTRDNDCDGLTDDEDDSWTGAAECPSEFGVCAASDGPPTCDVGVVDCHYSEGPYQPVAEFALGLCDAKDNDCDNAVDEHCDAAGGTCVAGTTTYPGLCAGGDPGASCGAGFVFATMGGAGFVACLRQCNTGADDCATAVGPGWSCKNDFCAKDCTDGTVAADCPWVGDWLCQTGSCRRQGP